LRASQAAFSRLERHKDVQTTSYLTVLIELINANKTHPISGKSENYWWSYDDAMVLRRTLAALVRPYERGTSPPALESLIAICRASHTT
jgi:hypothetical protein